MDKSTRAAGTVLNETRHNQIETKFNFAVVRLFTDEYAISDLKKDHHFGRNTFGGAPNKKEYSFGNKYKNTFGKSKVKVYQMKKFLIKIFFYDQFSNSVFIIWYLFYKKRKYKI